MQMTTKGRLAVVAMIDVALRVSNDPISLAAIARRRKISLSYLEQLFSRLRRSGIVESVRGPGGGYVLAVPAASISVADIVMAVDGASDAATGQMDDGSGRSSGRCDTSKLWRDVHSRMIELLGSISLDRLVQEQRASGVLVEPPRAHRGISSEPVVKPIRTNAPNSVFALAAAAAKSHEWA